MCFIRSSFTFCKLPPQEPYSVQKAGCNVNETSYVADQHAIGLNALFTGNLKALDGWRTDRSLIIHVFLQSFSLSLWIKQWCDNWSSMNLRLLSACRAGGGASRGFLAPGFVKSLPMPTCIHKKQQHQDICLPRWLYLCEDGKQTGLNIRFPKVRCVFLFFLARCYAEFLIEQRGWSSNGFFSGIH